MAAPRARAYTDVKEPAISSLEARMRTFLVVLCLAAAARSAGAATVYLKGGGRLDGAVVSQTERAVVIDTAQGRVSVDADRVERIENPAPPAAAVPAPAARRADE